MNDKLIYKVALPVPLQRLFDYLPPSEASSILPRGTRVKVPFGRQERIGIVFDHVSHSALPMTQLKPILSACDPFPLFPESLCDFILKASRYYHHAIGEVAFTGLPPSLRQGKLFRSLSL
jgi:primosomal protein N' (replication factor Y)